jgi:hypothetical protein
MTQPVSGVGEPGDNLMTAVGWFFVKLAFAYRFIEYLQGKNLNSIIQLPRLLWNEGNLWALNTEWNLVISNQQCEAFK